MSEVKRTEMYKPEFYVAPCWPSHSNPASQDAPPPTILIFGVELPLGEGLKRMADDGWKLLTVQVNPSYTPWHVFPVAQHFYLFRRGTYP